MPGMPDSWSVRQSGESHRPPTLLITAPIECMPPDDEASFYSPFLSLVSIGRASQRPACALYCCNLRDVLTACKWRRYRGVGGKIMSPLSLALAGDRRGHPPKSQTGEHVGFRPWSPGTVCQASPEPRANAWRGVSAQGLTQDRTSRYDHPTGVSFELKLRYTACVSVWWREVGVRSGRDEGFQLQRTHVRRFCGMLTRLAKTLSLRRDWCRAPFGRGCLGVTWSARQRAFCFCCCHGAGGAVDVGVGLCVRCLMMVVLLVLVLRCLWRCRWRWWWRAHICWCVNGQPPQIERSFQVRRP